MANQPMLKKSIMKCMITGEPYIQKMVIDALKRNDSGNISRAWNSLLHEHCIVSCKKPEGIELQPKLKYYRITVDGIHFLVENARTPSEFWDCLARYVYYHHESVTREKLLELFHTYISKYLKYTLEGNYPFQLDYFNQVCSMWLEKVLVLSRNKIPLEQKIIEVLARNPHVTIEQICEAVSEKPNLVRSIIQLNTLPEDGHRISALEQSGEGGVYYTNDLHEWKYQRHKIIQANRNPNGSSTFCLTLFGVLVALLLLSTGKKFPMGLFYKRDKYRKYFDTIAKNYATKLPLIFRNWDYLKSVLGTFAYTNFHPILNKAYRNMIFNVSVINGGNRELYFGVKALAEHKRIELQRVNEASLNAIYFFRDDISSGDNTKIYNNSLRLKKIYDLASYVHTLVHSSDTLHDILTLSHFELTIDAVKEHTHFYDIPYLERCLSHEIASVYFLNLDKELEFEYQEIPLSRRYNLSKQKINEQKTGWYPTLRDRLQIIHDGKSDIGAFLDNLKEEIRTYYSEVRTCI